MAWVEVFAVLAVSHVIGDFVFQTEFQALRKFGGLGQDPVARRALGLHVLTYTLCFLPAFAWLAGELGALPLAGTMVAVLVPHAILDDGRAVRWWLINVKHTRDPPDLLSIAVDQAFHFAALLLVAVAVGV